VVPKVTKVKGSAVAVDDWLLDDLDPADTGVQHTESERVMASRLDENGFLVRLEKFPSAHQGEASALLAPDGTP
jgi:hypothetical protein